MICSYCYGKWVIKIVNGYPRQVCSTCGYIDNRRVWANDVYVGPPAHRDFGIKEEEWQ